MPPLGLGFQLLLRLVQLLAQLSQFGLQFGPALADFPGLLLGPFPTPCLRSQSFRQPFELPLNLRLDGLQCFRSPLESGLLGQIILLLRLELLLRFGNLLLQLRLRLLVLRQFRFQLAALLANIAR